MIYTDHSQSNEVCSSQQCCGGHYPLLLPHLYQADLLSSLFFQKSNKKQTVSVKNTSSGECSHTNIHTKTNVRGKFGNLVAPTIYIIVIRPWCFGVSPLQAGRRVPSSQTDCSTHHLMRMTRLLGQPKGPPLHSCNMGRWPFFICLAKGVHFIYNKLVLFLHCNFTHYGCCKHLTLFIIFFSTN